MSLIKVYTGLFCLCFLFIKALSKVGNKCNASEVITKFTCDNATESCDDITNTCQCQRNYIFQDGTCTTASDNNNNENGNGALIAGVIIPILIIGVVISSFYLNKKFKFHRLLRQRLNQRNSGDYDEFIFGHNGNYEDDDDPPLS